MLVCSEAGQQGGLPKPDVLLVQDPEVRMIRGHIDDINQGDLERRFPIASDFTFWNAPGADLRLSIWAIIASSLFLVKPGSVSLCIGLKRCIALHALD
jgi:hypothetical protein